MILSQSDWIEYFKNELKNYNILLKMLISYKQDTDEYREVEKRVILLKNGMNNLESWENNYIQDKYFMKFSREKLDSNNEKYNFYTARWLELIEDKLIIKMFNL